MGSNVIENRNKNILLRQHQIEEMEENKESDINEMELGIQIIKPRQQKQNKFKKKMICNKFIFIAPDGNHLNTKEEQEQQQQPGTVMNNGEINELYPNNNGQLMLRI